MNEIQIVDVAVRQADDGCYSLNDLHRASGGEKRHSPSYWLSNAQTAELVAELETTGIPAVVNIVQGRNGGTWVCKEMVYAYAMWVSAAFHLRVIRAFDAMVSGAVQQRALTPAEMFLQNAQAMVDIERRQAEQEKAVAQISLRVEEVAQTQLLTTRPAASESITHMRPRAAKMFGLPERVVEQVIRQSPIAPRPAGMVKNDRAEAEGSSYAVYWIKDVNDVLRRFVGECRMVTASFAEHPYIDGRFKLAKGGAA